MTIDSATAERDQLEMLLRERERDRKEFFATLAHEMRNPIQRSGISTTWSSPSILRKSAGLWPRCASHRPPGPGQAMKPDRARVQLLHCGA
jgi:hypothetical protein